MREKVFVFSLISIFLVSSAAESQVIYRRVPGPYPHPRQRRQKPQERWPKFEPRVNLYAGYGFPNLDQNFLPYYYDLYRGSLSQTGPINATLDYQFSRTFGIGVMVTRGIVSAPYYDYNSSSPYPVFRGRLDNWSFMINMMRYFPVSEKVTPYLRTAIGVNAWNQEYSDANGNKLFMEPAYLPAFAYQLGLGAKFNLSQSAGLFIEAGYGKYILNGGLALKF